MVAETEHRHIVYVPGTSRILLRWTDEGSTRIDGHEYGPGDCEDPNCPVIMKPITEKLTGAHYARMPFTELADHPDFNGHAARVMFKILGLPNEEIIKIDVSQLKEC